MSAVQQHFPLPAAAPPPLVYEALVRAHVRWQVPVRVLVGVAWVESRYDPQHDGGDRVGLMGLTLARAVGLGVTPWSAEAAAMGAARYLAMGQERFGGEWERSIAAYIWHPRHVAQRPDPAGWPAHVLHYVRHVALAGPAAPIPFPIEVVQVPIVGGQGGHARP